MKKFFAIIMTLCILASALCITAFAEETTARVVIRVAGMKENNDLILPESYATFEGGWNRAAKLAQNHDWMDENGIVRIVVDLYDNWNASGRKMGSGEGFEYGAIRVPGGTRMMINMNGHTINRGLTSVKGNCEVIFMGKKSDLIINGGQYRDSIVMPGEDPGFRKMGKITGGYSDNGAGGIHMDGNGRLTLNNVHLFENKVRGDDGAAIAMYNNSTLVMNGGSISNSLLKYTIGLAEITVDPFGSLFVKDSTAILNYVTIDGNYTTTSTTKGLAIYAKNSTVTMDKCIVSNNGVLNDDTDCAMSIIAAIDSEFSITDTDFTCNGAYDEHIDAPLFHFKNSSLTLERCDITGNKARMLFLFENSDAEIKSAVITDNESVVVCVNNDSKKVNMIGCILGNNTPGDNGKEIQVKTKDTLVMTECTLGDTTFEKKNMVSGVGSVFGEGSIAVIVAILALASSVASIFLTLYCNKKKTAPAVANKAEKTESGE